MVVATKMQTSMDDQAPQFAVQVVAIAHRLFGGQHRIDVKFAEQFGILVVEGQDVGGPVQSPPLQIQGALLGGGVEDDVDRSCRAFGAQDGKGGFAQGGQVPDLPAAVAVKGDSDAHRTEKLRSPGIVIILLRILPRVFLSRLFGSLSRIRRPRLLAKASIRAFHAGFRRIDLSEAKRTERSDYQSLQDFFTREIRHETRPLAGSLVVSPSDGAFGQAGEVRQGLVLQAKGIPYKVADFLQDEALALSLEGGAFCTVYLAPWNYHRVHHAIGGELVGARHIPGDLWPVNKGAVEGLPGVFVKNERASVSVRTPHGMAVAVMVGAYNVGSIRLAANRELGFSTSGAWEPSVPLVVAKGDELGIFELGSTVVLLIDKNLRQACGGGAFPSLGTPVRMGEALSFPA